MKRLSLLFVLAIILAACAPGDCDKSQVQSSSKELSDSMQQWFDAYKIASNSSRISLSTPIQSLQTIRRQVDAVKVPKCMERAKGYLFDSMNYTVDGFLSFMGQDADSLVQNKFNNAQTLLTQYNDEMDRIIICAPNCDK